MTTLMSWLKEVPDTGALLLGALLATCGWIYTSRRNRKLSRKQHTFTALLNASFNDKFQNKRFEIREFINSGKFPDGFLHDAKYEELRQSLRFVLNYYEFIAAGVRNGDISERLLKDSERGTIVRLYECALKFVNSMRDARNRRTTYEHIEWLYIRWSEHQPNIWHQIVEWVIQRPLYHERQIWVALAVVVAIALLLVIGFLHLPGEIFSTSVWAHVPLVVPAKVH